MALDLKRSLTRLRQVIAAVLTLGLAVSILPHTVQANFVIPVVRVECMPEFGVVSVQRESLRGRRAFRSLKEQPQEMAAKYGYYELSSYFIIEGEDEEPPNPRIVGSRAKTIECQLADHGVTVTIEPDTSRPCPSAVTIRLTLEIEGVHIIEDLAFERSCIQRDTISNMDFKEDGEFIFLDGTFDDARKDELGAHFVEEFVLILKLHEFRSDRRGQDPLRPLKTFEDVVESWRLYERF